MSTCCNDEKINKFFEREAQEIVAMGSLTTDTLAKLGVSIDNLPQKHRQLISQYAIAKSLCGLKLSDSNAFNIVATKQELATLDLQYENLKLKQRNELMQLRIDRNNKFLEDLNRELELSRTSLESGSLNKNNIQDLMRQLKQKLTSYEEAMEKSKAKFSKLEVPEALHLKNLTEMASSLARLKAEEADLRQQAEDVSFVRNAKETFKNLKIF